MKAILVSALLAATSLPLANAGEIVPFEDHFVSTRSRADVMAETARAAEAGELRTQGEIVSYPSPADSGSLLTRSQVREELARAAAAGELSAQNEITSEPVYRTSSPRSQLASGAGIQR